MKMGILKLATAGSLLLPVVALGAESAPTARFAAPDVAATLPHSGIGGIGQVTVALLIVLALVFGLAILLKKMRTATGAGPSEIEILAQTSLGAKERAIVVRVDGARLLLGVAQGQVSLLHVLSTAAPGLPTPGANASVPEKPNFAQLLRRSLGR